MKAWYIVLINLSLLVLAILAITLGSVYNVPDLLRINYGFPFIWGGNTLSTIHGPVDLWDVDIGLLAIDLLIWLTIIGSLNSYWLTKRKKKEAKKEE